MKGSPGCPISGPLSPHHKQPQPKTRPGCLKPRFGVRPINNNMTGTNTILHQKTVMTNGVQVREQLSLTMPIKMCIWSVTMDHNGAQRIFAFSIVFHFS